MKGRFLSCFRLYTYKNPMEVKIGDKQCKYFPVTSGLRQGFVLSSLFTSLYFNGII